jgi:hypothetical protein
MARIEYTLSVVGTGTTATVSIDPNFGANIELRSGDGLKFKRGPATTQPIRVELTKSKAKLSCALPSRQGSRTGDIFYTLRGLPLREPGPPAPPAVFIIGFTAGATALTVNFEALNFTVGVDATGAVTISPAITTQLHSLETVTFLPVDEKTQQIQAELLGTDVDLVEFQVAGSLLAGQSRQFINMARPTLDSSGNILITFVDVSPGPGGNSTKPFP